MIARASATLIMPHSEGSHYPPPHSSDYDAASSAMSNTVSRKFEYRGDLAVTPLAEILATTTATAFPGS
jgi:hypothetical protein